MFILIMCAIAFLGTWIYQHKSGCLGEWPIVVFLITVIMGIVSCAVLIINPMEVRCDIAEFHSVQLSVDAARENGVSIEDAAMQLSIIESNKWLASTQYYNSIFIIGDYIPDEVDLLEPIK